MSRHLSNVIAEPPAPVSSKRGGPAKKTALTRGPAPGRWVFFAAAVLSAVLLTLACPPFNQGWLGWIALTPLFWAMLQGRVVSGQWSVVSRDGGRGTRGEGRGDGPKAPVPDARRETQDESRAPYATRNTQHASPFLLAFTHGVCYLLLLAPWFGAFSPAGYPVAAVAWGLLSGALFMGVLGVAQGIDCRWTPPLLAAGWTLQEWFHAQGTLAFPWGTLSSTQYRALPVLQMLDLTGAYGLTFLMALFAAALAALLVRPPDMEGQFHRSGRLWTVAAGALALVAAARGEWILRQPAPAGETVRVALIQSTESRPVTGSAVDCVSPPWEYDQRTQEALAQGAELVVWPEMVSDDDLVHEDLGRERAQRLLVGTRGHLLAGSRVTHMPTGMPTNSAVMVGPDGSALGQYAKVLIVPFGEYLPARPLLAWTERLGMPSVDLRPGEQFDPLPWTRGRVGASICFESAWGEVSRSFVRRGANLLAILTSDGWNGRTSAGYQHASFAPLRAVETRRGVARAAATGVSQLIDPYGRVLRSLSMFSKGIVLGELPLRSDLTLFARLGDWPVGLAWLILVAASVQGLRRRPR